MGNPFQRVNKAWQGALDEVKRKKAEQSTDESRKSKVPPYQGPSASGVKGPANPALRGTGTRQVGDARTFVPGYKPTYDRAKPVTQAMNAAAQAVTGVFGGNAQMTPEQYRRVLSGEAYGVTPGEYLSGQGAAQNPYDVTQIGDVADWQKSLDYQDAAAREQNRKAINSFSGIPRFINRRVQEMDTAMSRVTDAYKDPYGKVEQVRINRGAPTSMLVPAYEGTQPTAGGGYGGDGGYPGYPRGGGGGGGGGYDQKLPPWYYGLSTWRI